MEKKEITSVKDAVHKLQLYLLEGIQDENQLCAAGSLMSRWDCVDVVTGSRAFAGSLQEERCSMFNIAEVNGILKKFENVSSTSEKDLGKNGDLGFSN
ncbi:hypothetical protein Ancab_024299 [Ancistrocladus abbreviatus]